MIEHSADAALQRQVTALVLGRIGPAGFALAGSGAIREHGITDRPTHDVDLFTTTDTSPGAFADAVAQTEQLLEDHGYRVTRTRSTPEFARILVQTDQDMVLEVDLGFDWRGEPPAQLAVGPVLALTDAVGSKLAAVYSRGEVRDFLDLDAIRQSGRFTDTELLALAEEHDPGFDMSTFSQQLRRIGAFGYVETAEYGVDADRLDQIKQQTLAWADQLAARAPDHRGPTGPITDLDTAPRASDDRPPERLRREARGTRRPALEQPSHRRDGPQSPSL